MAFEEAGGGVSEGNGTDSQDDFDFFNMSGNEGSRGQADLPQAETAPGRTAPCRTASGDARLTGGLSRHLTRNFRPRSRPNRRRRPISRINAAFALKMKGKSN